MKSIYGLGALLCFSYLQGIVPPEVQAHTDLLCQNPHVACVQVTGFTSSDRFIPASCACQTIKGELLQYNEAVMRWYQAFADARTSGRHDLIRLLARLAIPVTAAMTAWRSLREQPIFIRLPGACMAGFVSALVNNVGYQQLSAYLDGRASEAALAALPSIEDAKALLEYLEGLLYKRQEKLPVEAQGGYELLEVSAYDRIQSPICSYVSLKLNIPLPFLFATSPSGQDLLRARIQAVRDYIDQLEK